MFVGKFPLLMVDLDNALNGFEKSLKIDFSKYNEFEIDMFRNGQIQKFEYTIELLWKTLKQFFEERRKLRIIYPLEVKAFFIEEAITEDTYNHLYEAIKSRNLLSHIYKLEVLDNIYSQLTSYAKAIRNTYTALQLQSI